MTVRTPRASCIEEIRNAGAEYLGLVLNYATPADCDRFGSKSRISEEVARGLLGDGGSDRAPRNPLLDDGEVGRNDEADSGRRN